MPHTTIDTTAIESVLTENRVFDPPADIDTRVGGAYIKSLDQYRTLYDRSISDPEGFWSEIAEQLDWFTKWETVLEWKLPDAMWFVGGTTNICQNCIDRQIAAGHGDQVAIIWEGEPFRAATVRSPKATRRGEERSDEVRESLPHGRGSENIRNSNHEIRHLTYHDLKRDVCRFSNALKKRGVKKGDIITIYMGMVPELAVAMLACARIGAVHSIIFGGFSSQAIVDRVVDANSKVIVTCDGAWRRGKIVPLKDNVDEACDKLSKTKNEVQTVVVLKRCENSIAWHDQRDQWWNELTANASDDCPCEEMDSEDMLFLLYTSGSTGKPKGIVHTTGGYMVYTYLTSQYVFNLVPDRGQVFWCTADIGWVTGHSYIVYGILPNRVPTLMYEGAPNHPQDDRFWEIVARHKVTQFYTAPTAIRAFMKWGEEHPRKHDLSSLRVLGTVGEPINPEAWMWYHRVIGNEKCPIVDTWWQTETGGHLLTPLPAATPTVPGSCTLPFFGIDAAIVNEKGEELPTNSGGLLAIRKPWPAMLRGIYCDRKRFIDTYFTKIPGMYFPGDGARCDERGYFWIMGRVDDVINVSGHRLGTMEVESALVSHKAVVEAAVVGMPHEIKGTGIAAFCTLEPKHTPKDTAEAERLKVDLREHVTKEIGAIARPDLIRFTESLPKTRSGKIMRRLLRSIASGEEKITQDTTTLEDFSVLAKLKESEEG